MSEDISKPRRTRRTYTAQFKVQLVAACRQPGASIAALAREHHMNANVLHRWLKEHRVGMHLSCGDSADAEPEVCLPAPALPPTIPVPAVRDVEAASRTPAFIPMDLRMPVVQAPHTSASISSPADIRIECCHHGTQVTVHWPLAAAAECRSWLQSLLRGPG
ncbi:IS66-like element accessory protein TnpA [Comamonas testosteroni]|uniref:IS66-like element accessory protein TnpA n=1 Tax=Comamonas testosteroni TaxID=285 RepID=UPI00391907DA